LRQADFLVLPSRFEGLPIIILEAMAAGCPILATAVDGNAEILRDQQTALLVPPEDVRALAEALSRLLDQPTLRANLAAQAMQAAEVFSASENARRLMAVYDQALAKPTVLSVETS
jgi:glycosyltransferase involved in cell wall biosynthesis